MPIPNQPLSSNPIEELWPANGAVERIEMEGAVAAADGNAIVVALEGTPTADAGLEAVARESYRRLLRGVARFGYPNVVRIWNYVPRIHEKTSGIDRYMCFCKGRSEAFAAHYGDAFASRLPAASAVGCPGDALVVHALATRDPVRYVENPRQVSAYRYPERYGPKSPSFARGTVTQGRMGGAVFVSGTASIVGHESVFPGDPLRQTAESMRNIETVLNEASVPGPGGPLGSRLRSLRVSSSRCAKRQR